MELKNRQLGSYKLISLIGKGGMAEVWLASQLTLNREVAVKILPEATSRNEELRLAERFAREAHSIAHLDHPSILPVIDYGNDDDLLYLVMPYVRGGSLQERLRRDPLSRAEAFAIFERVLNGLSYAHRKGIVHRDLKPGNILLYEDGRAVIADFGVAKTLNEDVSLTQTGTAVGSPEYMAPEQFMGFTDFRSDLYSMGVILYQLLTGRTLYSGTTSWEIALRHMNDPLPLPHPLIPQAIEYFLTKTLQKKPEERYDSAEEMEAAFHRAVSLLSSEELQFKPTRSGQSSRPAPISSPVRPATPPPPMATTPLPRSVSPTPPSGSLSGFEPNPQSPARVSNSQFGATPSGYAPATPAPASSQIGAVAPASGASPVVGSTPVPAAKKNTLPIVLGGVGVLALLIIAALLAILVIGSGNKDQTSDKTAVVAIPTATVATTVAATVAPTLPGVDSSNPTVPAGAASITVNMVAQNGTQVVGTGVISDLGNGKVKVLMTMTGLTPGIHNAHIHSGSCVAQGPIKYPLTPLFAGADGKAVSSTVISADFATITGGNLYLNAHNESGTPTYVASCGDIAA
jgi:serine/threonine protein kinase